MTIELDFFETREEETLRILNGEVVQTPTGIFFDSWVVSDDGIEAALIEVQLRGDTLVVNSISSEGGPSTLGPAKIRAAFRLLVKEYPGATKIAGKRVTGARTKGKETMVGDFGVPEITEDAPEISIRVR